VKRSTIIIIVLFSVLGVLLLVYFLFSGDSDKKPYQWSENYKTSSDQPYGTLFIKELLKEYRPGEKFIFNEKKPLKDLLDSTSSIGPADYIFIGKTLYLEDADQEALLSFIKDGNDAFIATTSLPIDLLDQVYINECDRDMFLEEELLASITFNFYNESLRTKKGYTYSHRGSRQPAAYNWQYITSEVFCDSTTFIIPLGYQQSDHVNFFKIPYGDGNLYFHTNPIAFTNYYISKTDKATYAEAVFSHLRGKAIIWDEFSKLQFSNDSPEDSPLSYILKHKSLKYAWWMMLLSAVLYTFFAAKRKQRVIPVIDSKVNTSLAFVKMISALHFQNANHTDIARKKMRYFLYFIRAKYGIHAQPFTESHMKRLAEKSKIDLKEIQVIFNEFNQIERNVYNTPAQDRLVTLYNAIDQFYKHCK
jgi:hypothetical protein